jgi:hypothetical protein
LSQDFQYLPVTIFSFYRSEVEPGGQVVISYNGMSCSGLQWQGAHLLPQLIAQDENAIGRQGLLKRKREGTGMGVRENISPLMGGGAG